MEEKKETRSESEMGTDKQRKFLFAKLAECGIEKDIFEGTIEMGISEMTKADMSKAIDILLNKNITNKIGELRVKFALSGEDRPAGEPETKQENRKTETQEEPPAPTQTTAAQPPAATSAKLTVEKPSSRPALMARMNGIPAELADMFFSVIDGSLYIKLPGLLYMASKKGYSRIVVDEPTMKDGTWYAKATVYPVIPKDILITLGSLDKELASRIVSEYYGPVIGYGRANKDNVKTTKILPFLPELAAARATARALRLYTGYGGTSEEELPDARIPEIEGE
jgi:hypothetical protein